MKFFRLFFDIEDHTLLSNFQFEFWNRVRLARHRHLGNLVHEVLPTIITVTSADFGRTGALGPWISGTGLFFYLTDGSFNNLFIITFWFDEKKFETMFWAEIIKSITNRSFYVCCIVYCYGAFIGFYLKISFKIGKIRENLNFSKGRPFSWSIKYCSDNPICP